MSKTETKKTGISIDYDKAIQAYNRENPNLKQINQTIVLKEINRTHGSLLKHKNGKAPEVLRTVKYLMDKSGLTFDEIVKFD